MSGKVKRYVCVLLVALSLLCSSLACSDDIDRDNLTVPVIDNRDCAACY